MFSCPKKFFLKIKIVKITSVHPFLILIVNPIFLLILTIQDLWPNPLVFFKLMEQPISYRHLATISYLLPVCFVLWHSHLQNFWTVTSGTFMIARLVHLNVIFVTMCVKMRMTSWSTLKLCTADVITSNWSLCTSVCLANMKLGVRMISRTTLKLFTYKALLLHVNSVTCPSMTPAISRTT